MTQLREPSRTTDDPTAAPPRRVLTLATNVGLFAAGIGTSVIISRSLGPAGRGEYVTWQAWSAAIGVFGLGGLPQVLVLDRWTPGRHKPGELVRPLALSLGAAGAAVAVLVALRAGSAAVLVGALLSVVATQFGAVAASEAQRMGRMGAEFNVARLVPPVAAFLAIVCLVPLTAVAVTWFVAIAACQAAATVLWVLATAEQQRTARVSAWHTVRESLRLTPGSWVTLLQYRFDLLAVAAIFPHRTVGYYATGVAVQSAVLAVGQVGGMHRFARWGRDGSLRAEVVRTVLTACLVALPAAVTAPFWVREVYGAQFAPAVAAVVVLCGVGVVQSVDYLFAHECLTRGHGARVIWCRLPAVVVLVVGFGAAAAGTWDVAVAAVVPGAAYLSSVVVFAIVMAISRKNV